MYNGLQRGALTTQRLGAFLVVPDGGLSQLQLYFSQPFLAIGKVKDTP